MRIPGPLALSALTLLAAMPPPPPDTPQAPVVDTLHGEEITDPYRWLEDGDSPEVQGWAEAQTKRTEAYLAGLPGRAALEARLEELLGTGAVGTPTVRGGRLFWTKRLPGQDHAVLYWAPDAQAEGRVLLDPNLWSEEGTVALDWWVPSHDGTMLAYGQSQGGSEQSTLFVVVVESGERLPDTIPRTRWGSPAWRAGNEGFYYARYPVPGTVPEGEEAYHRRIHYHALGTSWEDDPEVFGEGRAKEEWPSASVDPSGRWLLVDASRGWDENSLFIADLQGGDPAAPELVALVDGENGQWAAFARAGWLWLHERTDAHPNGHLLRTPLPGDPADRTGWVEVVAEAANPLDAAWWAAGRVVLSSQVKATERISFLNPATLEVSEMALPGLGSVGGPTGGEEGETLYYSFQSYDTPPAVFAFDAATGASTLWDKVDYPVDPSGLAVSQVEYQSADGTPVTMFLVHKEGLARNGDNPTMLSGYGGFNISRRPYFSATLFPFLEAGGVYAVPNLRGGGEYGEAWHQGGMLANKQNTFDDFIAAAEWLIAEGYTNPDRLLISGGSNGGLLVGAVMTQRPDLYKAVVCAVPLLDMLRYHKFLIARLWIPEYGDPDVEEEYGWLRAYSPYHNLPEGGLWPSLLLMTADKDSRVDPLHARKFAALVQSEKPAALTLLRVELDAGHGQGKPVRKVVAELADRWGFIFSELGMSLAPGHEPGHGGRDLAGGDLPAGLGMAFDDPNMSPDDQEVKRTADGYRLKANGNAVFWLEGWEAEGDFTFSAHLSQVEYSTGHPHYGGLVFGGQAFAGAPEERRYAYFSVNSQGRYILRRFAGEAEVTILGDGAFPAAAAAVLGVRAHGPTVDFLIDGEVVASLPRESVAPAGRVGFRIGHLLDVTITGVSLTSG